MQRRRTIFTLLALSFALFATLAGGPGAALAQEPEAVSVANEDGVTVGSIAINEVIDPFTDVDPAYAAEPGTRYVAAQVAFDADAGERFDIAPWTIVLQDDAGYLWNPTSLILPDDAVFPELSSQTLAPGSRVTGIIGYNLPEGANPAHLYYQPVSSRLVPLASLIVAPPPQLGDAVPVFDSEANEGVATVVDVVDPLEPLDPASAAPEGTRYVQVTLRYENPGEGRFFSEPYGLLLKDANGDLWSTSYVNRMTETEVIPDLTRVQLAPGDRVTGAATFAVPADVPLAGIYLSPTSNQLLQLAALAETEEVVPVPVESGDTGATTEGAGDPCTDWLEVASNGVLRGEELGGVLTQLVDPAEFAQAADELELLAGEQEASAPPAGAEPANRALVATLRALAGIADEAAANGGLDADDPATIERALARLAAIDAELATIAGSC